VWIAALAGGEVLNFLLKGLFARPRPSFSDPLATALYFSFPSGHATMSLIAYGLIAYFLYLRLPRAWMRVLTTSGLILLVMLIGLSRLYLGVHYFSDVLAGFAVGGLWLSFCITGMNFLLDWRARHEYKQDEDTTLPTA
jgi:undecaprenyl-diphosphatase